MDRVDAIKRRDDLIKERRDLILKKYSEAKVGGTPKLSARHQKRLDGVERELDTLDMIINAEWYAKTQAIMDALDAAKAKQ